MAKLWRRACGWVGDGERRSMMRRTSRGVSRLPALVAEQRRARRRPATTSWRIGQPRPQRVDRRLAERHPPLLGPLAPDRPARRRPRSSESTSSPHSSLTRSAAAVEDLEHGVVATAAPVRLVVGRRRRRAAVELAADRARAAGGPRPPEPAADASDRRRSPRRGAASGSSAAAPATLRAMLRLANSPGREERDVAAQMRALRRRPGRRCRRAPPTTAKPRTSAA